MIPIRDDNPTEITPYVTMTIMGICIITYLWQFSHDAYGQQVIVYSLGTIPVTLFGEAALPADIAVIPPTATLLTSMFLHGGWMHLGGNMLYLWIFGNNVEDAMGHGRYLIFYLICGFVAVFAHALPNSDSVVPMVGASGAISGVLGAYLLLHPHAKVLLLIPLGFLSQLVELRAIWVLGGWFVLQLVSTALSGDSEGGGVAFGAHIGGFLAGLALIPLFKYTRVPLKNPLRS